MRKKTFRYILFACLACLLVAGFVLRQQFYGNAVRAGRDLYIGSRADYQSLTDSLLPRLRHHWAFGVYARRINLPETFKPGHYVLEPGMSVIRVARMLKLGFKPLYGFRSTMPAFRRSSRRNSPGRSTPTPRRSCRC